MTDTFATELTQKIAAMGLNSKREIENVPVPPGLILITGHFVKDDEGNRFRQTVIGLGKGLPQRRWLEQTPAIGVGKSYKSPSSSRQKKNIADKVSEQVAKYFVRQGWINTDLAK